MTKPHNLDPFFYPHSIAIVGASADENRPAGIVLKNLLNSFHGEIYPVNPKYTDLHGTQCFPSVTAIPSEVSLSVLITPPAIIPELLKEHAEKNIRNVIIASAGFGETEGGGELEQEIKEIASRLCIRIIGPNCLGVFHPSVGLDTFFLPYDRVPRPHSGTISIVSQSGSILGVTLILLEQGGLGVSKAISYGNRVDVSESELIEYLSADDETNVIGLCVESISDGRRFIRAAQGCPKPIVAMKLGQEPDGQKASRSHTGSMAGRYEIFRAAFRRSGISEAGTFEEFLDLLNVFSMQKPSKGRRVLILTNAGGIGVMTADHCNKEGLEVSDIPPDPKEKLKALLPSYYSISNPVDLTGSSTDKEFVLVLSTCLDYFDAAILIPFMTVPGITPDLGDKIINSVQNFRKPIISLLPYAKEGKKLEESFRRYGIPLLPTPVRVVRALTQLLKKRLIEPLPENISGYQNLTDIITEGKKENINPLSLKSRKRLLDVLNLRYPKSIRAQNESEAIAAAGSIGFPLAIKIASPDIIHKTDANGVRLNIRSVKELQEAYKEMLSSAGRYMPDARILGFDVEEMVNSGIEIIIGGIRDPQFGPVVMFGLGGIFVETLKDVAFEIAPVSYNGAKKMMESIKGYPILAGVRGMEGVDLDSMAKAIVAISEVMTLYPGIGEIDINPAIASSSGMIVVDARIILA